MDSLEAIRVIRVNALYFTGIGSISYWIAIYLSYILGRERPTILNAFFLKEIKKRDVLRILHAFVLMSFNFLG